MPGGSLLRTGHSESLWASVGKAALHSPLRAFGTQCIVPEGPQSDPQDCGRGRPAPQARGRQDRRLGASAGSGAKGVLLEMAAMTGLWGGLSGPGASVAGV